MKFIIICSKKQIFFVIIKLGEKLDDFIILKNVDRSYSLYIICGILQKELNK